jgi:hypothetical protein
LHPFIRNAHDPHHCGIRIEGALSGQEVEGAAPGLAGADGKRFDQEVRLETCVARSSELLSTIGESVSKQESVFLEEVAAC